MKRIFAMSVFLVLAPNIKLAGGPVGPAVKEPAVTQSAPGKKADIHLTKPAKSWHHHQAARA